MRSLRFAPLLALTLSACNCNQVATDLVDATPADRGVVFRDATPADAPQIDAEGPDAAVADAEPTADAELTDVELADAELADAELTDAELTDAGTSTDAGVDDGGTPLDAEVDAGDIDAGPADIGPTIDLSQLTWSIRALIDPRAAPFGDPQTVAPRNVRGLALSPDGLTLYAGYLNTSTTTAEIRRIGLSHTGTIAPFLNRLIGYGGKALAVDDAGRVYAAGQERITVHAATLGPPIFTVDGLVQCDGVAVTREAGALVLYSTDRTLGTLERRVLTETGTTGLSGATLDGLGGSGQLTISPAGSLRNVKVDPAGRIWIAAYAGNRVYRVAPDGTGLTSAVVQQPFDLGFDGPYVLITHNLARDLTRIDAETLAIVPPSAAPPWSALGLVHDGQNHLGALTGLVVIPQIGFFVANETGATVDSVDPGSGLVFRYDDPILWAEGP